MRVLLANLVHLSIAFITIFVMLAAFLALVVAVLSFVFWTIPPVPPIETVFFVLRVFTAICTVITFTYMLSNDYKQSVQEYLSS